MALGRFSLQNQGFPKVGGKPKFSKFSLRSTNATQLWQLLGDCSLSMLLTRRHTLGSVPHYTMSQHNLLGNWTVMPPCTRGETQHARAKSTKKLGLIPSGARPTPCQLVLETPSNFSHPRERNNKYSMKFFGRRMVEAKEK